MVRMSESERNELWDRWEAGESQRSIARALGRPPETVRTRLLSSGWRRPVLVVEWCSLRQSKLLRATRAAHRSEMPIAGSQRQEGTRSPESLQPADS